MDKRQDHTVPLPEPGLLRAVPAPHWHGLPGSSVITMTFVAATSLVLVGSVLLFGWATLRIVGLSVTSALIMEAILHTLMHRPRTWSEGHALMLGLLMACTMPPTVSWKVPVAATSLTVFIGHIVLGGLGNHPWHSVAIGRVLIQWVMPGAFTLEHWPVLARGQLIWGSLRPERAEVLLPPASWSSVNVPAGVEAWLRPRPVDQLRRPLASGDADHAGEVLAAFVRDHLPPWQETLLGTAGGAIGEAMVLVLLVAGMLLMWRGILRGTSLLGAVASFLVLAMVLPVQVEATSGTTAMWLPGVQFWQGWPIGLVYVFYQLTAGSFLFVVLLLGCDPSSSPLTRRGQLIFGVLLGSLTIALRCFIGLPADAFWALLIANSCVPAIDRLTHRRVFGT